MKFISTIELNEELAHLKDEEHAALVTKITSVVKPILTIVILGIAMLVMWGFIKDSIAGAPLGANTTDIIALIMMRIIQNLLLSACMLFVMTSLIKVVKYFYRLKINF